jgi:hypothetical protein
VGSERVKRDGAGLAQAVGRSEVGEPLGRVVRSPRQLTSVVIAMAKASPIPRVLRLMTCLLFSTDIRTRTPAVRALVDAREPRHGARPKLRFSASSRAARASSTPARLKAYERPAFSNARSPRPRGDSRSEHSRTLAPTLCAMHREAPWLASRLRREGRHWNALSERHETFGASASPWRSPWPLCVARCACDGACTERHGGRASLANGRKAHVAPAMQRLCCNRHLGGVAALPAPSSAIE